MKKTRDILYQVTDGLAGTAVNGVLYYLYWFGASIGKSKTSYGAYQAFREAHEALADFNYDSFKHMISKLRRQGLLTKKNVYSDLELDITERGKQRISELFPQYQTDRPWDGFLYLVSYDIPEHRHNTRNLLRSFLKRVGCALLQESLWLTPYNPRKLLDEFVDEHEINGTILISKLGRDGTVGDETLSVLLDRVYHLSELNNRYKEFMNEYKGSFRHMFSLRITYDRIVKDDPQLPYALLPKDWKGDEAYRLIRTQCTIA